MMNGSLRPEEISSILQRIMSEHSLSLEGIHGVAHWSRVMDIGRQLAAATGASLRVVELFALFHDSKRLTEGYDPDHGRRGGDFAHRLHREGLFKATSAEIDFLHAACVYHTDGLTEGDVNIRTCWDSDRLDLGRVGIVPLPELLCTDTAREREMLEWAYLRSRTKSTLQVQSLVELMVNPSRPS
jgi:uncharacterized protein